MSYRSGFERTFAADLQSRGIKFKYEAVKIPYVLECIYNPDWYFTDKNMYIETKGILDASDRRKHLAIKAQHPELDIRFVFMRSDGRMKGSRQTHASWAQKNGFQFAEGKAPDEWFK